MKIKSIFPFVLFLLLCGLLFTAQNSKADDIALYADIYPHITSASMSIERQFHRRIYDFHGTAVIHYQMSDNSVAYTDEHYDFEVHGSYNWVTGEFKQFLHFKNASGQLDYEDRTTSPLDPVLFDFDDHIQALDHNETGSLLQHSPDSFFMPHWFLHNSYSSTLCGFLANLAGKVEAWREIGEDNAKTLKITNAQNGKYKQDDNILIVAQQYIADDLYVNRFGTTYQYPNNVAQGRTLLSYGKKTVFKFTFEDGITTFSKTVNMHGGTALCSLPNNNLRPGNWQVTAKIIESETGSVNYPESEILKFEVIKPFLLWSGWSGLTLTPTLNIDPSMFTFKFSLPEGKNSSSYDPIQIPIIGATMTESYPLAVEYGFSPSDLTMRFKLPAFKGPVDLYFGIASPQNPQAIYFLYPDKSLHPLTDGLTPWETAVNDSLDEIIFDNSILSQLPAGMTLDLYLLLTPHNDLNNFHLWSTYFTIPNY